MSSRPPKRPVYPEAFANILSVLVGFVVTVALFMLILCSGCTPGAAYIKADRLFFDAVAPDYVEYVDADTELSDDQKERRRQTIRAKAAQLEEAEK